MSRKSVTFLLTIAMAMTYSTAYSISVSNGGSFGSWGPEELCPGNHPAIGFSLKVEKQQGNGDDTALNSIALKCADGSWIYSTEGQWGDWTPTQECTNSRLKGFQLRVEKLFAEIGDDTAANDINFVCTSGRYLSGNSPTSWGDWGDWSDNCKNGIRGLKTKVEPPQGKGDDTALNDVEFVCF